MTLPGIQLEGAEPPTLEMALRNLRIVLIALVAGALFFTAIVFWLVNFRSLEIDSSGLQALWLALPVLALVEAAVYPILRKQLVGQLRRRIRGESPEEAEPKLLAGYFSLGIIGLALVESVTLFAAMIYMLTGETVALMAVLAGVLLMLAQWPTEERYQSFVERVAGREPT